MSDYTPRIYVADLADYVNGKLRGEWFTVLDFDDADALLAAITAMLAGADEPGHEEWAIHDTDDFAGVNIGEYENLEMVFMHARMLAFAGEAWAAYVSHFGADADETEFEDRYQGEWGSGPEFARELYEDIYYRELEELPTILRYRIDWDGVWRDLRLSGDYVEVDGFIFSTT